MTHAVMRGSPTKAQLHLETLIRELVAETGREEDRHCLGKILFKRFKDNPYDIGQIEGSSGVVEINRVILERAVRTARALQHAGLGPGDTILVLSRSTLVFTGLYYGSFFAGVTLYLLHFEMSKYEMSHFLNLKKPSMIFIESQSIGLVEETLKKNDLDIMVVQIDDKNTRLQKFSNFISKFEGNYKDFRPADTHPDDVILLTSTSGSTGLPKVAALTNKGLSASITSFWAFDDNIPKPSGIFLCISFPRWITYTMSTLSSVCFGVAMLYTVEPVTAEHIRMLLRKYKPTMTLMPPYFVSTLLKYPGLLHDDLSCLDTFYIGGSVTPKYLFVEVEKRLHKPNGRALGGYGMTELSGVVTFGTRDCEKGSVGTVINTVQYKIVDEQGEVVRLGEPGELLLKSNYCFIKEYVNNEEDFKNSLTSDGWYKTGDSVCENEKGQLFYVDRIKFMFKYKSVHICPSEMEAVISGLEGVHCTAVCESDRGAAALVVRQPGHHVTAKEIHDVIKDTFTDKKRLRGGIIFVESLPHTSTGKINRKAVKEIINCFALNQIYFDETIKD